MTNTTELKESVEAVAFWLDPRNAQTRKELAERNPPLEAWLDMVQKKVQERMAQVEQEREMKV